MERWAAKVLALIGIFILPFVCTVLPIKLSDWFAKRGEHGRRVLSCLMCFGGGVFFATFILHMGPEVRLILNVALLAPNHITYPVADLMMAAGFFLVLFIENISVRLYQRHRREGPTVRREGTATWPAGPAAGIEEAGPRAGAGVGRPLLTTTSPSGGDSGALPLGGRDGVNGHKIQKSHDDVIVARRHSGGHGTMDHRHSHHSHDEMQVASRSLVLMLALSLHRIFEGMTVGLKHTTVAVGNMFIAVICHETVIGFSLGLQFVKHHFTVKRTVFYSFLCSLIMPIGVAIGTILMEVGKPSVTLDIVNGTMQAISTGTFIYVTFFEILQGEITHDADIWKLLSLVFGFSLMALLSLIPEGSDLAPVLLANQTAALLPLNSTFSNNV